MKNTLHAMDRLDTAEDKVSEFEKAIAETTATITQREERLTKHRRASTSYHTPCKLSVCKSRLCQSQKAERSKHFFGNNSPKFSGYNPQTQDAQPNPGTQSMKRTAPAHIESHGLEPVRRTS